MEKNQSETGGSSKAKEKMLEEEDTIPFEKTSTMWKEYESTDAFKGTPQSPHFRPLITKPSVMRGEYALILMQCWLDISEALHNPGKSVAVSQLELYKETLLHLVTHGFDVEGMLSLTNKGLKQSNVMEEQKGSVTEMEQTEAETQGNNGKRKREEENLTSTAVVDSTGEKIPEEHSSNENSLKRNREGKLDSNIREKVNNWRLSYIMDTYRTMQPDTPKSTLEGLKMSFSVLEKYGVDVTYHITRTNMLISFKDEQGLAEDKLKDIERRKTEGAIKLEKVKKDMREAEGKILELQRKEAELRETNEAIEKEIADLQSCEEDLGKKIRDPELQVSCYLANSLETKP